MIKTGVLIEWQVKCTVNVCMTLGGISKSVDVPHYISFVADSITTAIRLAHANVANIVRVDEVYTA